MLGDSTDGRRDIRRAQASADDDVPASTLTDVIDGDGSRRRARLFRRTFLTVLTVVIAVALAGLLDFSATSGAEGGGYRLSVEYPRVGRAGMDTELVIRVAADSPITEPLTIAVGSDYLDLFADTSFAPTADSERSDGQYLYLDYEAPDTRDFQVTFGTELATGNMIHAAGDVRLLVKGRPMTSLHLSTWLVL